MNLGPQGERKVTAAHLVAEYQPDVVSRYASRLTAP